MSTGTINTLLLAAAYGVLFIAAEWLHHRRRVPAEGTRKIVHVCTGLLALSFPLLLDEAWQVLTLCGTFLAILLLSQRFNGLRSINGVDRVTRGSLLYPVVVAGCFLLFKRYDLHVLYYLPILIMAVCDPVAAFVGMRWPRGRFSIFGAQKTLSGSTAFLLTATLIAGVGLGYSQVDGSHVAWLAPAIGVAATVAEALTGRGYDNLAIPAVVVGILIPVLG